MTKTAPMKNILELENVNNDREIAQSMESTLTAWYNSKQPLKDAKDLEAALRKQIVSSFFPSTVEGSGNKCLLMDGQYFLQATQTVTRKVDAPSFKMIKEEAEKQGIPMDDLVDWEPKLNKAVYNELDDEQRKFFDQCLTIKDGSVSIDIKPAPKSKS